MDQFEPIDGTPAGHAGEVTSLLHRIEDGDREAAERLLPLIWDTLRARAVRMLANHADEVRWQPTAIVDEAFVRLIDQRAADWRNRSHFLAVAAIAMRRIVSDHARRRVRACRDGRRSVRLTTDIQDGKLSFETISEIDDLLGQLTQIHARSARVVELRFFGGLGMQEVADTLDVSLRTVEGDWQFARAWLHSRLSE